jgi:hypothetical protein
MAFVLKKYAKPGDAIDASRANVPVAPGAVTSPQIPGMVPDRSTITGEGVLPVPAAVEPILRPRSEYGTSQRIMGAFLPKDGNDEDPARFEQTAASYEELRKAYPNLRTPLRPAAGYALVEGTRVASDALAALSAQSSAHIDPGE